MAYLAIRGSGAVNGVSACTAKSAATSSNRFLPHWPAHEIPVGYVTNGVHTPTWDSAEADELWTGACGKNRWHGLTDFLQERIRRVSDADLWQFRLAASKALWSMPAGGCPGNWPPAGRPPEAVDETNRLFDPRALTLGFARRFAAYKRPNLLLHDPPRLLRLLTHPERPVQLIIAGKAHPDDREGKALIREWIEFIRQPEVRPHIIFLSDYDMQLTEKLVQGVDVWINTPRRPWEACGTSGMKVLVNGGINLSVLDGWWAEAYSPEVGWALGDGREHGDDPARDAVEAEALYDLLEREVIPEFFERDARGVPRPGSHACGKHGASDAALLGQPHGARIHRTVLPPGGAAYLERAADQAEMAGGWRSGAGGWGGIGPRCVSARSR